MLWPLETDLKGKFPSNAFQKKEEFVFSQQLSESIPQPPAARLCSQLPGDVIGLQGLGRILAGWAQNPPHPATPTERSFVLLLHGLPWLTLPTTPWNLKRNITSGSCIQGLNKTNGIKCREEQSVGL